MALGGGVWTTQNKIIPGTYVNIVGKNVNSSDNERGVVAVPVELDWGEANKVITLTKEEFERDALILFGYEYDDPKLIKLREVFRHATKAHIYRMCKDGVKASNDIAEAKFVGTRGNNITIVVKTNVDEPSKFDVETMLDGKRVDRQIVAKSQDLVENAFVTFKQPSLSASAGKPLISGTNGTTITGKEHQEFLAKVEPYKFNCLVCPSKDEATKKIYTAFTKRLRDEIGQKFQTITHNYTAADYEGVISVKNNTEPDLVYWVAGASASIPLNGTLLNMEYDGEYAIDTDYTQFELEMCTRNKELVFHKSGEDVVLLNDINTLKTYTDIKTEIFTENKVIRVTDSIAIDTANIFNKMYLGNYTTLADDRVSLWNDVYSKLKEYETAKAINKLDPKDLKVLEGKDKDSVAIVGNLEIVRNMAKAYVTYNVI